MQHRLGETSRLAAQVLNIEQLSYGGLEMWNGFLILHYGIKKRIPGLTKEGKGLPDLLLACLM